MSFKKITTIAFGVAFGLIVCGGLLVLLFRIAFPKFQDQIHFERDETKLVVLGSDTKDLSLFVAGDNLDQAKQIEDFDGEPIWLTTGNYYLKAELPGGSAFYPVPLLGYRSGTEKDDSFAINVRPAPETPPSISDSKFTFIPGGHFLFGNQQNTREPHYVWTPGYFIGEFEVTNGEFRAFIEAADGYANDSNWTDAGKNWKKRARGASSSILTFDDPEFRRFGQDDHPVTQVTWFEASAYCRWLTRKVGNGRWLYSLPTEAEWEKAARGPDNFDFPLSRFFSDAESVLYNWRKNPSAEVTVIGSRESIGKFRPNRYGVYHLGGNVVEWTLGLYKPFNREKPYMADDGRNNDHAEGVRVVRGGSWYSASKALMYIPYRDTFLPEISHNDLGFRVVVRNLMN